jgi:hypothetical protein
MLQVPLERQAIIDGNVGIVYLTKGEELLPDVLSLLLHKWEDLEILDQTVTRPFARFINRQGTITDSYRNLKL